MSGSGFQVQGREFRGSGSGPTSVWQYQPRYTAPDPPWAKGVGSRLVQGLGLGFRVWGLGRGV